jgi:catechol 2,3-dioxygenase-like lactoylglutathione lyase family enzyme
MHHASRTVGDMDRSLRFYCDLLGFDVALDTEMTGEMLEREVGLEGAHLRLVELVAPGDGMYVELLQYLAPAPARTEPLRPCDVGAHHLALLVDDINGAHRALVERGVRFTCAPQEVDAGFFAGHWTAYCFDPDDLIVELWQLPGGSGAR